MNIEIKTLTKKMFFIEIQQENTIKDIKLKIQEKEGIPINMQKLILASQLLDDDKKIQYYSIKNNDTITLFQISRNGQIIFIDISKEEYLPLEVEPTDSIESIKLQIQEQKGFQKEQQELFFNYENLSNEKTISDFLILENNVLQLLYFARKGYEIFINVLINPPDIKRYFPLQVQPTDLIKDIKSLIEHREKIPMKA